MTILPLIIFAAVALGAIAFATVALLKPGNRKGRGLLAGAIALFLLGVGGGTYWMVGSPDLALREGRGLNGGNIADLVPLLIQRVRKVPGDQTAWRYLGSAYMSLNDADDAVKAYGRALTIARLMHTPDAALNSAYGEALVAQAGQTMTPDAEAAFNAALALNPKDPAARFFIGQARLMRGDRAGALALWQSLLADTTPTSPLHQMLVDRIAQTTAAGGGAAPNIQAMVAGLAARLRQNPNDPAGWLRLIRAYAVLGQADKAGAALTIARRTFPNGAAHDALEAEAKELKLN